MKHVVVTVLCVALTVLPSSAVPPLAQYASEFQKRLPDLRAAANKPQSVSWMYPHIFKMNSKIERLSDLENWHSKVWGHRTIRGMPLVTVVADDILKAAADLVDIGLNPVLVASSQRFEACAAVEKGALSQEAEICRRTLLYPALKWSPGFKYYIPYHGVVYTPYVPITHDRPIKPGAYSQPIKRFLPFPEVGIISSAAVNRKRYGSAEYRYRAHMKIRMRTQILAAIKNGHNALVLSAFGCGFHGGNPNTIAKLYDEALMGLDKHFKRIVVAIAPFGRRGREALQAFRRHLSNVKKSPISSAAVSGLGSTSVSGWASSSHSGSTSALGLQSPSEVAKLVAQSFKANGSGEPPKSLLKREFAVFLKHQTAVNAAPATYGKLYPNYGTMLSKSAHEELYDLKRWYRNNEAQLTTHSPTFGVYNMDTVRRGVQLQRLGLKPAILNMANAHYFGGGVQNGSMAQEEEICRLTFLYSALAPFFNSGLSPSGRYHIEEFGTIYSPQVPVVFLRPMGRKYAPPEPLAAPFPELGVVSSAAYNLRSPKKSISQADYLKGMEKKIRAQILTAIKHGHDAVVLGAFGCGAFGGDADVVAKLYENVLLSGLSPLARHFKHVDFAVLVARPQDQGNFDAFRRHLPSGKTTAPTRASPTAAAASSGPGAPAPYAAVPSATLVVPPGATAAALPCPSAAKSPSEVAQLVKKSFMVSGAGKDKQTLLREEFAVFLKHQKAVAASPESYLTLYPGYTTMVSGSTHEELADLEQQYAAAKPSIRSHTVRSHVGNRGAAYEGGKLRLAGYRTAIINLANEAQACGKVKDGGMTEEEDLCRSTLLYSALDPDINPWLSPSGTYNISEYGTIHSPHVALVFRERAKGGYAPPEPYPAPFLDVGVVSSALGFATKSTSQADYLKGVEKKIRSQILTAILNHYDSIVIPAFDCGPYGGDPEVIAKLYDKVLIRGTPPLGFHFKYIVFAIPGDGPAFSAFSSTF